MQTEQIILPPKILITGAMGRMGAELVKLLPNAITYDKGGNLQQAVNASEVIIDFSSPEFSLQMLEMASSFDNPPQQISRGVVLGTTGFNNQEQDLIAEYSHKIPILHSHNMSLGVNILIKTLLQIGSLFPEEDFDAEILEMHHKHKKDAPSGTAISFGQAIATARGINFDRAKNFTRQGRQAIRNHGEIGFATLRGGSVVGEHKVIFASEQERVELSHKAENRAVFAKGAVFASKFIYQKMCQKQTGLFSMQDALALRS